MFSQTNESGQPIYASEVERMQGAQRLLAQVTRRVFGWMFVGILITAFVAGSIEHFGLLPLLSRGLILGVGIAQIVLVIVFTAVLTKSNPGVALAMFLAYSAMTGVTISTVFIYYSRVSVLQGFVLSSLVFGAMALYGAVTKRDLSGLGSMGYMLLIGALLLGLVNLFFHFPMMMLLINYAVLAVFIGLTAYHMQSLKKEVYYLANNESAYRSLDEENFSRLVRTLSISYALTLYLDFINIFLRLLNLSGRSNK